MRQFKELGEAAVAIQRLRNKGGCQSVWHGRFLKAVQKLEDASQGKAVSRKQLVRSVSVISEVLCRELLKSADV